MDILKRFKRALKAFTHGDLKTAQRFDGARFNPSDAGTWAHVDNLSYDAANDYATRARIRASHFEAAVIVRKVLKLH